MKKLFCVLIVVLFSTAVIAFNLFTRVSADPADLPSELNKYVRTGAISAVPDDDYVIERFAKSDLTRKLIGGTFRVLLRSSFGAFPKGTYRALAINETYAPTQLSIYFVDPEADTRGLLQRFDVYSARSFPKLGIVLVNFGFIKKLVQMEPFVENLANEAEQVGADKKGHKGDQVIVGLQKKIEGAGGLQANELFAAQASFICIYVVIHELGHIQDYAKLGDEQYRSKAAKLREEDADQFFATQFVDWITDNTSDDDRVISNFIFTMATNGMLSYLSHQLVDSIGKTEIEVYTGKDQYQLRDSIFSSHPPLAHRLLQVLYYCFRERERKDPSAATNEADVYRKLLEKVVIRRSILP